MPSTLRLVDYVKSRDGWAPGLPRGIGFALLAAPGVEPLPWGLFSCEEEVGVSRRVRAVPDRVSEAVEHGEGYPPALALARDEMTATFTMIPSDEEFCHLYAETVERHLELRSAAPYLLAEAAKDDVGYLTKGDSYWLLRYLKDDHSVRWVSDDYFVYQNPGSDFVLTEEQRHSLLLPFPMEA